MLFFNVIKNPKIVKKNGFGGGLWIHLGRVWDGLGRLLGAEILGAFGCFLAAFGAFQIDLFSSMGARWAPKGLGDRSWVDFGRVWEGFGRMLTVFWTLLGASCGEESGWDRDLQIFGQASLGNLR